MGAALDDVRQGDAREGFWREEEADVVLVFPREAEEGMGRELMEHTKLALDPGLVRRAARGGKYGWWE